jgi:hypothetical protein
MLIATCVSCAGIIEIVFDGRKRSCPCKMTTISCSPEGINGCGLVPEGWTPRIPQIILDAMKELRNKMD